MIEGKFLKYKDGFSDILEVRKRVFLDELNYPIDSLTDELDLHSDHVIVFNEKHEIVASGRLSFIDKKYWISKVAVLKEERGKYYGDFVVRMLVDKVFRNRGDEVWVKSNENTYSFFSKLGFTIMESIFNEQNSKLELMKLNTTNLYKKCCK